MHIVLVIFASPGRRLTIMEHSKGLLELDEKIPSVDKLRGQRMKSIMDCVLRMLMINVVYNERKKGSCKLNSLKE